VLGLPGSAILRQTARGAHRSALLVVLKVFIQNGFHLTNHFRPFRSKLIAD
jgi:hypothetical protein